MQDQIYISFAAQSLNSLAANNSVCLYIKQNISNLADVTLIINEACVYETCIYLSIVSRIRTSNIQEKLIYLDSLFSSY